MNLARKYPVLLPAIILFAASCIALIARAASGQEAAPNGRNALPVFPFSDGWLGADDAYSIPLGAGKSLWLFGDTFVGDRDTTLRSKSKAMIHNSIGISTCGAQIPCTMQYFWRDRLSAKPRAFFDTGSNDVWYWPLDGVREGDTVYLALMMVSKPAGAAPDDPFGFKIDGTVWATVSNLSAPPDQWHISTRPLTHNNLWPGVSMVRDGDFVLLYTQVSEGQGNGHMIVLRVPRSKLDDPAAAWEYLAANHKWEKVSSKINPLHVIDQGISEMSVRYNAESGKWIAISPGPEFLSSRIVERTASSPIGPWSDSLTIFQFPEMKPGNPSYDKDAFCYATKEHVEFSNSNLVLTYACNASLAKVTENMRLYRPQVVVVDAPR